MKVFLGGTCGDSTWRSKLTPHLTIDYFDPVVDDWNEEAYQEELRQREECDFCLYFITPNMEGVYSIAEVIDDSNKRPEKTVFIYVKREGDKTFTTAQTKSLDKVGEMVKANGGNCFTDVGDLVKFLNSHE